MLNFKIEVLEGEGEGGKKQRDRDGERRGRWGGRPLLNTKDIENFKS